MINFKFIIWILIIIKTIYCVLICVKFDLLYSWPGSSGSLSSHKPKHLSLERLSSNAKMCLNSILGVIECISCDQLFTLSFLYHWVHKFLDGDMITSDHRMSFLQVKHLFSKRHVYGICFFSQSAPILLRTMECSTLISNGCGVLI